jgi:hypothetical protein
MQKKNQLSIAKPKTNPRSPMMNVRGSPTGLGISGVYSDSKFSLEEM